MKRREFVNARIKRRLLAGRWLFAAAIILVVLLLALFVGLPGDRFLK